MKHLTNKLSFILALVLMVSIMATACSKTEKPISGGQSETSAKTESGSGSETASEELPYVELNGYLLGEAPAGFDAVQEKLNEMLIEDINTKVNINYISWGDFSSKYPLILAAGDDVDFIYTANWSFYAQESAKGAFYEITEANMEKYMPLHYEVINRAAFEQAKINGKMYMVTTPSPDRKIPMMVIRGDLREKYGVPEVTKMSEITPYLEAIKANEPNMMPMNLDSSFDITIPYSSLVFENTTGTKDVFYSTGSGSGVVYKIDDTTGQLTYMLDNEFLTSHKAAAEIVKSWYEAGYINQDIFANDVRSKDAFLQGQSAVGFGNSQDMQAVLASAQSNGWDVELIPLLDKEGHYEADPFTNNGIAVAASSENPERTMMFIDRIINDKAYNYLVYFGLEGVNYVEKDGKIDLPEGVTADSNTYPPDAAGFWFTNKNQFLPLATWPEDYVALKKQLAEGDWLINNPMSAFTPQPDEIATEVANLNQTIVQYFQPIQVGMAPDIDAAFSQLEEKLKEAGIEKVKEVVQSQIDTFLGN